jgi:quinol monooxygenase YgiN
MKAAARVAGTHARRPAAEGSVVVTSGLLIRLQPKSGEESAVEALLSGAIPTVDAEPGTTALFMIRFGPTEYGIFNAFPDEAARQAHMTGHAAEGLFANAHLFAQPPAIEPVDIIAAKLPD